MSYSKLETQILKNLRDWSALGRSEAFYPFSKFFDKIKEDIWCSEDELQQAVKMLNLEGLLEADIDQHGKVTGIQGITGFGLRGLREALEGQAKQERMQSVVDSIKERDEQMQSFRDSIPTFRFDT